MDEGRKNEWKKGRVELLHSDESNINGTTEIQVWGKEEGGKSSFVRIIFTL